MRLSYVDLLGDGERHEIDATITTAHSASSHGQPVVLLPDGGLINLSSWVLLNYKVVEASSAELPLLQKFLNHLDFVLSAAVTTEADSADNDATG